MHGGRLACWTSEGETEGSSHVRRWRQQEAVHWEQVTEDLHSFSVTTCPGGGACLPGSCVDPIKGYSSSCSPGSEEGGSSETIEVVKPGSQEHVQSRTVERIQDDLDEVIQSIPQERISEHITDQTVDVSVPYHAEVVKVIPHERTYTYTVEQSGESPAWSESMNRPSICQCRGYRKISSQDGWLEESRQEVAEVMTRRTN